MEQAFHLLLDQFRPVQLKDLGHSNLMNRFDSKFVFHNHLLEKILSGFIGQWDILEINHKRIHDYENVYLDTEDKRTYLMHHNKRRNRFKFRYRNYVTTEEKFLEIKIKDNKDRTTKLRMPANNNGFELTQQERNWIEQVSGLEIATLSPCMHTDYKRITLISAESRTRITLDTELQVYKDHAVRDSPLDKLCIMELKQESPQPMVTLLRDFRKMGLRPMNFSKYCLGVALCYPDIKSNAFKAKLRKIKDIQSRAFVREY